MCIQFSKHFNNFESSSGFINECLSTQWLRIIVIRFIAKLCFFYFYMNRLSCNFNWRFCNRKWEHFCTQQFIYDPTNKALENLFQFLHMALAPNIDPAYLLILTDQILPIFVKMINWGCFSGKVNQYNNFQFIQNKSTDSNGYCLSFLVNIFT